jgi:eukaryotic-like serine/threonine-protein kinase
MDFFRFIITKRFLKHLGIIILIFAEMVWLPMLLLRSYTHHGEYLTVPDFSNMNIDNVKGSREYSDFEFIVIDSVFDLEKTKGTVLRQDPFPEAKVKKGRKIYLTIVSTNPDKTSMPDLKSLTLRQAVSILESIGLKVGRISYIPAFDEDAVQEQLYLGKVIQPETKLDKGSVIDLTVGMGSQGQALPGENDTLNEGIDSVEFN